MDYKNAGVDIEAGYKSVELMKEHVKKTMRPEVLGGLGGFSGAFSLAKIKEMEEALQAELVDAWPFGLTIGDLRVGGNWTRNVSGVQEVLTEKATYEELEAALYELQAALNSSEEITETGAKTE